MADFAGYLAADELYDGPFGVRSAVDPHRQRRLLDEVLDHDPTREDILFFRARWNGPVRARGPAVVGITTDASPLYPLPVRLALGDIPHPIGAFHVQKALTQAVLRALAPIRKRVAEPKPALPRGRPPADAAAKGLHAQAQAIQRRVAALFEHRHLFVRHHRSAAERALVGRRARPARRRRALRAIMDEVYRLFDRRGRADTALSQLTKLRQRVRRYRGLGRSLDKRYSPNLEKALPFLDDRLWPATSNAVERGNRRPRKMQKTVYRVRTRPALASRMALDLERDQEGDGRSSTVACLHDERGRA